VVLKVGKFDWRGFETPVVGKIFVQFFHNEGSLTLVLTLGRKIQV